MSRKGDSYNKTQTSSIACVWIPRRLTGNVSETILRCLTVIAGPIERSDLYPDAVFIRPSAQAALYGSIRNWARTVINFFRGRGLMVSMVVGFDPQRTYIMAKTRPGFFKVLSNIQEEINLTPHVHEQLSLSWQPNVSSVRP